VPARLRPTAPIAADAVLVGDPGRALMLAQVLLQAPKMSNHARGLWGYSGQTPAGRELTIQATGMGGPSAAIVLADLAELGLRRAIRVGTCAALDPELEVGELLWVGAARGWRGGGEPAGEELEPDPALGARLRDALGEDAREAAVASFDVLHRGDRPVPAAAAEAADLQTAALFAHGPELGVALAAVLIVAESGVNVLDDERADSAAQRAGAAAAEAFSNPQV
jgi:purine-nucleoside phosphorylase